ncbi:leucine-rich repeat protein (LRRP) [Novymonas esmeraldas]|uniref:Leucine-rich repeat protein (LRRP) n=1 Tax=Novymonas esmeraldas TaxID=1808958 RepID=A0AAW0EKV8_9TRYP
MSQRDAEKRLSEEDCLVASQQYDPQFLFHLSVPRRGYHRIDTAALVRCDMLRVIDVSGNKLTSLSGLEAVAPRLIFLNAAENNLHDITALAAASVMERCMLEGNRLASAAALQPLVGLPGLVELVLQRSVSLSGADDLLLPSEVHGADELLLLDNPVCRDPSAYAAQFLAQVPHIRWVDGVSASTRAKSISRGGGAAAVETAASAAAVVEAGLRGLESTRARATAVPDEEAALRRQLDRAAERCRLPLPNTNATVSTPH